MKSSKSDKFKVGPLTVSKEDLFTSVLIASRVGREGNGKTVACDKSSGGDEQFMAFARGSGPLTIVATSADKSVIVDRKEALEGLRFAQATRQNQMEDLRLDYEIAKTKEDQKREQLNKVRRELVVLSKDRARAGRLLREALAAV